MGTSILVVGDNLQAAKVVGGTLASRGYEVRTASEPEAAIESVRARRPALIISELTMPGVDDLAFCRRVRETADVPVIIISANGDSGAEIAALDAGADDYLVKPLVTERLLARVRAALRRRSEEPEASAIGGACASAAATRPGVCLLARHPRVLPHKTLLKRYPG
jgi:two-component system KDP operon response regulator KdpE